MSDISMSLSAYKEEKLDRVNKLEKNHAQHMTPGGLRPISTLGEDEASKKTKRTR